MYISRRPGRKTNRLPTKTRHALTYLFHHPQELESSINEALDWLDDTPNADAEDIQAQRKGVEQIANPIMSRLYNQNAGPGGGGANDYDDYDFGDDEL